MLCQLLQRALLWTIIGLIPLASCNRKGGEGSPCEKPADCRYGFRCEDKRCIGGPETACGYVLRCLPLLSMEDQETLFGLGFHQFHKAVQAKPRESEASCKAQLLLIDQMNRTVVLNRTCGPRITK